MTNHSDEELHFKVEGPFDVSITKLQAMLWAKEDRWYWVWKIIDGREVSHLHSQLFTSRDDAIVDAVNYLAGLLRDLRDQADGAAAIEGSTG